MDQKSLKILLAEDCPSNQLLIRHHLETTPHCLEVADNGQEALKKATSSQYDLILMDIQMPIMNGFQAVSEIRSWERSHSRGPVPIVAVTSYTKKDVVREILAGGFNAHLAKPVNKTALLGLVGQYSSAPNLLRA